MAQQNGTSDGKGSSKDLFSGNTPHDSKRLTPKPAYSERTIMAALHKKRNVGQHKVSGEIIAANTALGIRLRGGLDFLKKACGYKVRYVTKSAFIDLVKSEQVTPFNAFKAETE